MTETIGSIDTSIASTVITMSGMNVNPVLTAGGKLKITEGIVSLSGGTAQSKPAIGTGATVIPIMTSTSPPSEPRARSAWNEGISETVPLSGFPTDARCVMAEVER
jgi:hypothetical protein